MIENEPVKRFWNKKPCGTFGRIPAKPDRGFFSAIKERRYRLEPFIKEVVDFESLGGKKVLEIGCGVGTDGLEFLKAGADYAGVDVSEISADLARRNLDLSGYPASLISVADAEQLPFPDCSFDFIYSWGVLHHTPNMAKAISEIHRVLKPGGRFCIMLYNRYSLVGSQLYVLYGLLRFRPFISWKKLFSLYHESPGTQALTLRETRELFRNFNDVNFRNIVTPYDLRVGRNVFLPRFLKIFVPSIFGFFRVIHGKKG